MSVSREDIVREARALVGCKFRPGGTTPATGVDQWGFLLTVARRLKLGDQSQLARLSDQTVYKNVGYQIVYSTLKKCVVWRRLAVEVPVKKLQPGDFATTIEPGEPNPETGVVMGAEPVLLLTALAPPTFIYVSPERGVIEEEADFKLHKGFCLRLAGIDLDEFSIVREQTRMAQELYLKAMIAKIRL